MLRHEDSPQTPPQAPSQSAANVRVTPEELAAAVTALQIRKEGSPGTIAIGDAVDELGLDVSPEEVLAEVEARRIQQRYLVRRLSPKRLKVLLAALLALIGVSVWGISQQSPGNLSYDAHVVPNTYRLPGTFPDHIEVDPNLLVGDASGKIVMLSEVGDNQPVHCRWYSGKLYQYSPGANGENYVLIKHDGRVYLRGWMKRMSSKVLALHGADISPSQSSNYAVQVTLPLKGFKEAVATSDTQMYGSTIPAEDIRLDSHAYEKW